MSHTPVLLHEVVRFLDPQPGDFVIDGTTDGGGHARTILAKIGESGKLLALDLDDNLIQERKEEFSNHSNVLCLRANYRDLPSILSERHLSKANSLLLDLGFSSEQLERSGRGFSFLKDEPLLMTYDEKRTPAREAIRALSEKELADILYALSGERFSRRIAKAIVLYGRKKKIETSGELATVIRRALPSNYEMRRIDPATRTFQALRMYVNDELGNLETVLRALPEILSEGGRAVIISFHSLEDALVKKYFNTYQKNGTMSLLAKKPIVPSRSEILENPRSRSAKLRAAKLSSKS